MTVEHPDDPSVSATALAVLRETFGYPEFRGQQAEIIEHVPAGGDALVLMPTGGGKSLCYQIPALVRPGLGIVVSPLIALMQDQVDALRQVGVAQLSLNSSLDAPKRRDVERALRARRSRSFLRRARAAADPALPRYAGAHRGSRCSPSTRRIASRNGATISGRNISSSRCCTSASPTCRVSR